MSIKVLDTTDQELKEQIKLAKGEINLSINDKILNFDESQKS